MNKQNGFTLIEMVVAISIMGIIGAGLLLNYIEIVSRLNEPRQITTALELAGQRLDLILGQRQQTGYLIFTDPCSSATPPAICTMPTRYSIAPVSLSPAAGSDQLEIAVTVTTASGARVQVVTSVGRY